MANQILSQRNGKLQVTCAECGKNKIVFRSEMTKHKGEFSFCNKKCYGKWISKHRVYKRYPKISKVCKNPNCPRNGEPFLVYKCYEKRYKYCSQKCSHEHQTGINNPTYKRIKVHCDYCGEFLDRPPSLIKTTNFCNRKCQGAFNKIRSQGANNPSWKGGKIKVPCSNCGKQKLMTNFEFKRYKNFFCNRECHAEWMSKNERAENNHFYGKKHSHKTIQKILKSRAESPKWERVKEHFRLMYTKYSPIQRKISHNIGHYMRNSLRERKAGRHWEHLVGYTVFDLEKRLKKTMPQGYDWDDLLKGKLHIDHIIPIAVFKYNSPADIDFQKCWSLNNLQLLPAIENFRKRDKLIHPFQPSLALAVGQ